MNGDRGARTMEASRDPAKPTVPAAQDSGTEARAIPYACKIG